MLWGVLLAGCGGGDSEQDASAGEAAVQVERHAIDEQRLGSIRGRVVFDGAAPARKPMEIEGAGGCHTEGVQLAEDLIVENGLVAQAFVVVKRGYEGWVLPEPRAQVVALDQKGCMYRPRVLGLVLGDTLRIANSDPTNHNINIRSSRSDGMNPTQAAGAPALDWKPTKRELMVPIECNLHPWMKAWVGVVEHPWFAVSASDGAFEITGVPGGTYTLEAWQEKLGKLEQTVVVHANSASSVDFVYVGK
jgi:hypothetical protein